MSDPAKIILSPEEQELVTDTRWILTKQRIIDKVYALLGAAAVDLQALVSRSDFLPAIVREIPPKIARGENYRQLPYVMLDYPRFFGRRDVVAIRTFFWWGHFISVNLQVAGEWLPTVEAAVQRRAGWLAEEGYQLCVNPSPWEHAFEAGNFLPFRNWIGQGQQPSAGAHGFLKTGRYISLDKWEEVPAFIRESAEQLLSLLEIHQAPSR